MQPLLPARPSIAPNVPATPSATPTLVPDAWQSLPIVPTVDDNTRRIYAIGQQLGNDPHAFSILGDCLSLPNSLFTDFGKGPGHYDLYTYTSLQPAIDWFHDSFTRQSVSLGNGFTSAAVLSPLMADRTQCQGDENPMQCEYRIHKPSYALVALGHRRLSLHTRRLRGAHAHDRRVHCSPRASSRSCAPRRTTAKATTPSTRRLPGWLMSTTSRFGIFGRRSSRCPPTACSTTGAT